MNQKALQLQLYRQGLNIRQIGERLGITRQGVSLALRRAGVQPLEEKRARAALRRMKLDEYCASHPTTPIAAAVAALGLHGKPTKYVRGICAASARKQERESRGYGLCGRCGEMPLSEMGAGGVGRCKACAVITKQALDDAGRFGTRSPYLMRVLDLHRAGGMSQREIGAACGITQSRVSTILRSARKRGEID